MKLQLNIARYSDWRSNVRLYTKQPFSRRTRR